MESAWYDVPGNDQGSNHFHAMNIPQGTKRRRKYMRDWKPDRWDFSVELEAAKIMRDHEQHGLLRMKEGKVPCDLQPAAYPPHLEELQEEAGCPEEVGRRHQLAAEDTYLPQLPYLDEAIFFWEGWGNSHEQGSSQGASGGDAAKLPFPDLKFKRNVTDMIRTCLMIAYEPEFSTISFDKAVNVTFEPCDKRLRAFLILCILMDFFATEGRVARIVLADLLFETMVNLQPLIEDDNVVQSLASSCVRLWQTNCYDKGLYDYNWICRNALVESLKAAAQNAGVREVKDNKGKIRLWYCYPAVTLKENFWFSVRKGIKYGPLKQEFASAIEHLQAEYLQTFGEKVDFRKILFPE